MQYVNAQISPELTYKKKKEAEQIKKSGNKSAKR